MDKTINNIAEADYVAITFDSQKNGEKLQTVVQHRSRRTLCPVKAWGSLTNIILGYEGTSKNTSVNFYKSDSSSNYLQASDIITHLRATCKTLNGNRIGLHPSKVGTHSIRMSFAMQLHLAGVRDFTIMMMGCWKSLALLRYIRPQIQEFSKELSKLMHISSS